MPGVEPSEQDVSLCVSFSRAVCKAVPVVMNRDVLLRLVCIAYRSSSVRSGAPPPWTRTSFRHTPLGDSLYRSPSTRCRHSQRPCKAWTTMVSAHSGGPRGSSLAARYASLARCKGVT